MAPPKNQRRCWTLYVGNLFDQIHWKGVWQVFDRHGQVLYVFVPSKRVGHIFRFGFVRMRSEAATKRVIERLNNSWIYGFHLYVSLARAPQDAYWRRKEALGRIERNSNPSKVDGSSGESRH
ncbi:hypothetical protein GQ457_13G020940 [Hibiscus cannabinus]